MKSFLFFGLLTILASFFSCTSRKVEVPPISKNGNWPVINIEEAKSDSLGMLITWERKHFNPGEKAFEFDESASLYTEYDNGVITRSGNYFNGKMSDEYIVLFGLDTVKLKIHGNGPWDLVLETVEKSGSNEILRNISGHREY